MKSKFKKRMIALTLCMVMVLSGSTSALADDANAGNTEGTEMVQQLQSEPVENEPAVASVEEPTSEPPIETPPAETTPTPEPTPETTPETTTPTPEPTTPTPEPTAPQAEPTPEPTTPTVEPAPAEETQEALELKKEIKDANGNVICTVTANIPEKTFDAKTSEVSMDVETVEKATTETIQNLMKKRIADDKELGEHFLYKISFKVNGTTVEPGREIKLTFEQKNFKIEDVKKANVFYYNEAYSVAGNAEEEIVEITQKSEKLEELQNAGQSTEGIEDYDLTEISLNGDGTANKIQTEGRRSTIYGCYIEKDKPEEKKETETPKEETKEEPKQEETKKEETEKTAVTMNYENDDVVITVSAADKDVIPEKAKLQVVPILSDDKETEEQYKEVEEKLNKKAENEAYDIAGFLAYDISFVDEDGNKVEPNGEVKVSMEYKKAAAPEGLDAEDTKAADVTVMHFEEDAEGQVKEVVDMAEQNKVEAVETTDAAKVTKAEFKTESFSTFTITWVWSDSQREVLPVNVVDEAGNSIGSNQSITLKRSGDYLDRSVSSFAPQISGYQFVKAVINDQTTAISSMAYWTKDKPYGCRPLQAKYSGKSTWIKRTDTVTFIYKKVNRIQEIATESDGIDIGLYNYNSGITKNRLTEKGFGFYASSRAKDGASSYNGDYTNSQNQGVLTGIVKKNLGTDAKPVLATGNSMGFLFGSGYDASVRSYEGLSGLFQKDENGYYYYDSQNNAAALDGSQIRVYNGKVSPEVFEYGNFLPFNNSYIENGSDGLNKIPREETDLWFGMNVGMTFFQPKGGSINNQDMVFEFSGDDDVWVFIDGMLVLDIGGIHSRKNGNINFRTGAVTVDGQTSSLAEKFRAAYREKGLSDSQITSKLDSLFNKSNGRYTSFKNYSTHNFEFFYMERGGGAANCRMKFNMPAIPEGSVMVTKEIVDSETGAAVDYAEKIDFQFYITKNGNALGNTSYDIYQNNVKVGSGTTDSSGGFTLRHDQSAVFAGFLATDHYVVKEQGAYLNGYEVEYEGKGITLKEETAEGGTKIWAAETPSLAVDEYPSVVFDNAIKEAAALSISKTLAENSGELADKEFPVLVNIQGEPYTGTYTKNGTTYTAQNGRVMLKSNETAIITGLPYGASFEVVEDLDGSYQPTYTVTGEGAYDVVLPGVDVDGNSNGVTTASGKIKGDCTVNIENREVVIGSGTTSVVVNKSWFGSDGYEELVPESIQVTLYADNNHNGVKDEGDTIVTTNAAGTTITSTVTLSKETGWTYTWKNLPADTDFVLEEVYPEGFEWKTTSYVNKIQNLTYLDRTTTCAKQSFDLGKNNMLLVKRTDGYSLWTAYNLGLTAQEIREIAAEIQSISLPGAGNLNLDNLDYIYGTSIPGANITLTPTESGWNLKFGKTSVWAQFWNFQYDRTEQIHLENQIDGDFKTQVTVNKVWLDENYINRPDTITVQLMQNDKAYGDPVVISKDDDWTHTFTDLPYYGKDANDKYFIYQYTVTETKIGEDEVVDGVAGEYELVENTVENNVITLKNEKANTDWHIVKRSSSDANTYLEGAVFKLASTTDLAQAPYFGKSDATGTVIWYADEEFQNPVEKIEGGTYTLSEIEAPAGYMVSSEKWTIEVTPGGALKSITSGGKEFDVEEEVFYFDNTPLYELPSTGGNGIYWYMIGGMLLMLAAALILYKNRCKEVLKS